jgi:phosphate uptake regulator
MNFQPQFQTLRVQLLGMSRLSQYALDSSIKGYELHCSDFCRNVGAEEEKLYAHHSHIHSICRQLIARRRISPLDLRFVLAASHMNDALHMTYDAAARIARDTMLLLKQNPFSRSVGLGRLGRIVNGSMRLCIVALFQKEACHARAVLQDHEVWQEYDRTCNMQNVYERSIAQSLGVAARQTHILSDAILFWLQGKDRTPMDTVEPENEGFAALETCTEITLCAVSHGLTAL